MVEIATRMRVFLFCIMYFSSLSFTVLAAPQDDSQEAPEVAPMTLISDPVEDEDEVDPVEMFERAQKAMDRADINDALFLLRAAAWENYTPAQVRLGEYFDYAEFDEDAVGWFLMAAFQGNVSGAFGLAKMYATGEGIDKREDKALFWYRFAAERNHLSSVKVLASAYKDGLLGVKKDPNEAQKWEDKIPRLMAIQKKEEQRKNEEFVQKVKDGRDKRKAAREEAAKKHLELQEAEKSKKEKASESESAK